MPVLDNLSIEITANTSKATSAIAKLANSLTKLSQIGNVSKTVKNVERMVKSLGELGESEGIKKAASGIGRLANSLGKLKEATEGVQKMDDIRQKLEGLSDIAKAVPAIKTLSNFQTATRKTSSGVSNFAKKLVSVPWEAFKNKVSGVLKPLDNLFRSFKRIAMYRALRTALKEITQGFATGVKNLYAWAGLVGNSFVGTMDSLATSMNYLRNSLGAMVSPLLDALAPAVDALVDKFVDLVNLVNQFFATMTGKTTWRKALKTQKEYADNTDDAAKAQARLNHQLMAFDELNNISVNNPSGRGGGGNSDDVSADDFEELELPDWAQDIKDAIDRGDWAGAGEALADKLNGIIEDWDSYSAGQLLGQKINNVLSFYVSFMDKFDWAELGKKFAGYVNGVFNSIDPQTLGQAMVAHIKAAFEFLANFIPNVDVSNIALAFSTAINELFSDENAVNVGQTIAGVINKGIEFLKTMITGGYIEKRIPGTDKVIRKWVDGIDFKQAGYGIFEAIGTAITNIKWEDLGTAIQKLAGGIVDMFNGACDWLKENPDAIKKAIGDFFSGLWGENGEGFKNLLNLALIVAGLKLAFSTVFGDNGLIDKVKTGVSGLLSSAGLSTGFTITAFIALAWAVSGIIDNIKTYGVSEGLWRSLSVMSADMYAKLQIDPGDSADQVISAMDEAGNSIWYVHDAFGNLQKAMEGGTTVNADFSPLWNEFVGAFSVIAPVMRSLGYDMPEIPDEIPKKKGNITSDTNLFNGIIEAEAALERMNKATTDDLDKELNESAAAVKGVSTAAVNARKKVTALPPSDDEISKFNDALATEKGAVDTIGQAAKAGSKALKDIKPDSASRKKFDAAVGLMEGSVEDIGTAAKNAGKKIVGIKPDSETRKKFDAAVGIMETSVGGIGTAATGANKKILGIKPTTDQTKSFAKRMLPWKNKVKDIGDKADDTKDAIAGMKPSDTDANAFTGKMASFKDKVAGVGTEAGTSKEALDTLAEGPYNATVTIDTEGYVETKNKLDKLAGVTEHTIKFKPIIDKDTTGFMGGSHNTFNFTLKAYAEGGFPSIGSMFVAGEAGPELVGTINGRNAVASGKEITGIGDAIYDTSEAEAALLREQNALLRQLLAKSGNVTLAPNAAAGRWVAQSQAAYARATGG